MSEKTSEYHAPSATETAERNDAKAREALLAEVKKLRSTLFEVQSNLETVTRQRDSLQIHYNLLQPKCARLEAQKTALMESLEFWKNKYLE